jgi:ADP-heptose:LPS heptosyltransferase
MAKRPLAGHWRGLWARAVGTLWAAIADTRRSPVAWLLPARRRFIMGPPRPGQHKIAQASAMVGAATPLAPRLWLGEADRRAAAAHMAGSRPILALAPTANWGGKCWPLDRFAALADRLTAATAPLAGARVAVFAGPDERAMALPLLAAIAPERRIDLAGTIDLLVAAACLAEADLFVGNDSGLMHMAAAMGVPTLGLFGPSREEHYGPWGPRAAAVRTDLSFDEILATSGYDHRRAVSHMTSLSLDKAHQAALALLARCRAEAGAR